jgi:dGTPase
MRSVFQRDRDRIIHSAAFRRLEYKTQVFINHEGDHYRTRLTHSLEVAQLARSMCRAIGLNEDLGEAVALAHDLGHTPFGHAGEDGLIEVMKPYGGFDHNAQALRILTMLEQRYAAFDGLNLTWETLEGVVKHNGPLFGTPQSKPLPEAIATYHAEHDLELTSYAGAEAQIAALSDDIAYNNHDIEDGIRAHFFTLEELRCIPLIAEVMAQVDKLHPALDAQRRLHEVLRRIINRMVADVLEQTRARASAHGLNSSEAVRALGQPLVCFSPEMQETNRLLKAFLTQRMYQHYRVNRMTSKARRVVRDLFTFFFAEPNCLPAEWYARQHGLTDHARARIVCDFIAGMTDRFALGEHQRVFDVWERT